MKWHREKQKQRERKMEKICSYSLHNYLEYHECRKFCFYSRFHRSSMSRGKKRTFWRTSFGEDSLTFWKCARWYAIFLAWIFHCLNSISLQAFGGYSSVLDDKKIDYSNGREKGITITNPNVGGFDLPLNKRNGLIRFFTSYSLHLISVK